MAILIFNSRQNSVEIVGSSSTSAGMSKYYSSDLRSDKKMDRLMSGVGDGCDRHGLLSGREKMERFSSQLGIMGPGRDSVGSQSPLETL